MADIFQDLSDIQTNCADLSDQINFCLTENVETAKVKETDLFSCKVMIRIYYMYTFFSTPPPEYF